MGVNVPLSFVADFIEKLLFEESLEGWINKEGEKDISGQGTASEIHRRRYP